MKKSKDTKKDASKGALNRRKPPIKPVAAPFIASDGLLPNEFLDYLSRTFKNRAQQYDTVKSMNKFSPDMVPSSGPPPHRHVVPFADSRRVVVVENDEEHFPAEYLKLELNEYIMCQALTKENHELFWKAVLYEQTRLVVCLTTDDEMTGGDDVKKCYKYFPTEPGQSIVVTHPKGKMTVTFKSKECTSFGSTKWHLEWTDEKGVEPSDSDLPGNAPRSRQLAIHQMHNWTGLRPDTANPLEQAETLARFFEEVNKAEMEILRKSMETRVPPVIIQSMNGLNRGGIAWSIMMLLKDVEKRECFDLIDIIRKLQKMRPGCLSTYYSFTLCIAVGLNVAIHSKWCEKDCQAALQDLIAKYPERKLDEYGLPVV